MPTKRQIQAAGRRIDHMIADAAGLRHGLTEGEVRVFYEAIHNSPPILPDGSPVPLYEIGMKAVRKARKRP